MSFVNHYLPYFRQQLVAHPLSALLPFQSLFTESLHGGQLIAPPPFLRCTQSTLPPLLCVPFQFLVYYSGFFFPFFQGGDQSVQGAMLAYPRGSSGNTACHLFAHLLVCFSQAGLEPVSGGTGALLFSQLCTLGVQSVRV
jgi:hypothetical protein